MGVKTNNVTIAGTKGDPTVSVIIGQRQLGFYRVLLKQPGSGTLDELGNGANDDLLDDTWSLGKASSLAGSEVYCQVAVIPVSPGPGELYDISIILEQDNKTVSNGLITEGGFLKNGIAFVGRFIIAVM